METKNKIRLVEKLAIAKKDIKETKIKKEGKNEFSKYDYFTPTQIEFLVQKVCFEHRMLTKFDLIRNDLGVYGVLTIFDLDSEETLSFEMATAIPEIKATNIAQQLGGAMTYTERYLKTSAFGITDNNLDFDSQNNSAPKQVVNDWVKLNTLFESKQDLIDADKFDAIKKIILSKNDKYYAYTLETLNKL